MAFEGACFVLMPVSAPGPAAGRTFEDAPGSWLPTTGTQDQLLMDVTGRPVESLCTLGPAHCGASSFLRVLEVRPVSGSRSAPTLTGRLELRVDPDAMLLLRCRFSYDPSATADQEEELQALAYRTATRLLARIAERLERLVHEARMRSFAAHPSQGPGPPSTPRGPHGRPHCP